MKIFELDEDLNVIISPEVREIPEFKAILSRDKDKKKQTALRELAFVYHSIDHRSVYNNYSPEDKEKKLIEDFGVTVDSEITKAIQKYEELSDTPIIRLLKSSRKKIDELATFVEAMTITEDSFEIFLKIFDKVPSAVTAIDKMEEKVKADQIANNSRTKANKTVSKLED